MNKMIRKLVTIETNEIRISKLAHNEFDIDSKTRYSINFAKDKITLTKSNSQVDSYKFYSFNNGYLKLVLKPEDIPDNTRELFRGKALKPGIEVTETQIILTF